MITLTCAIAFKAGSAQRNTAKKSSAARHSPSWIGSLPFPQFWLFCITFLDVLTVTPVFWIPSLHTTDCTIWCVSILLSCPTLQLQYRVPKQLEITRLVRPQFSEISFSKHSGLDLFVLDKWINCLWILSCVNSGTRFSHPDSLHLRYFFFRIHHTLQTTGAGLFTFHKFKKK